MNKEEKIGRRSFVEKLGGIGMAGALIGSFPWLQSCASGTGRQVRGEKTRIGIIGPGSRGQYHISHLLDIPEAEIVALCDNYDVNLRAAAQMVPGARLYTDYRKLLDDQEVDSVVITTPLYLHYEMAMAAFDAGKNVYCEKAMAYDIEQCHRMYLRGVSSGKIFFIGQQRLFDPKYLKAISDVKSGRYGPVVNIRNHWFRNADWRRPVPSPELERHINWRLYREYSRGLMTELACHQIQNGTSVLGMVPEKVMGSGSIIHWKDGREVFDNVAVIYTFSGGVNMTFESVISNRHFGMGEYILCKDATVDLPGSRVYFEEPAPKSGMKQMIADIEKGIFSNSAFAGTSWNAETAMADPGVAIMPEAEGDGSFEIMQAFCRSSITGVQPDNILREAYYGSVFSLLGDDALLGGKVLTLPEEYKI